jgi:hypothetical protein
LLEQEAGSTTSILKEKEEEVSLLVPFQVGVRVRVNVRVGIRVRV